METHDIPDSADHELNPDEAVAALHDVDRVRAAMADRQVPPAWFFVTLGLLIAPVGPAIMLLPDPPAGVALLIGGLLAWALLLATVMHLVVKRMRVLVWLSQRQMRPFAVILLPLLGVFVLAQWLFDPPWGSEVLTVLVGAAVIVFGLYHRRAARTRSS